MFTGPLLALMGALGCATDQAPEQLEALSVEVVSTSVAADHVDGFAVTGLLSVSGEGRDFHLRVVGDNEASLDLHLPGESELTLLDGRTVTLELTGAVYGVGDRGVAIYDGSGLVFLAQNSWDDSLGAGWFGESFATWGEPLFSERRDGATWTYTTAIFQDDSGEVELLPGEVVGLRARGQEWRAVVNAAWLVEDVGLFDTACAGPGDLLSFELLRAETEGVDVDGVVEAESEREAVVGCDSE